ncbi:MAG: flippase-like domain-containing protein [Candidatus Omnitrophota bacterium]
MTLKRQTIQFLLFLAGLGLFVFSVRSAGVGPLVDTLRSAGGWGIGFLAIYSAMNGWETFAWRFVFPPESRRQVRFGKLYFIRLAGQAVNNVTPFIDIGGEFLKYSLAAQHFRVPRSEALASIVLSRTMLLFSEILFWSLGFFLAVSFLPGSEEWRRGASAGMLVFLAACAGLFILQKKGFFLSFARGLERAGIKPGFFKRSHQRLGEADAAIGAFYAAPKGRFARVLLVNFLGWVLGGVEMWALFHILGNPVSFPQAVMMESFLHLVRTLSFFIPGNVGAQEAGLALLAQGMGFHPSLGVAISLMKRFRQYVWIAVGFLAWGYFQQKERAADKPLLDCDTPLDFLIHRPLAAALVRWFAKFHVSPNQVSFLALFCSFLSAGLFATGSLGWGLGALLFFYFWAVLDNTDGELARVTGKTSEFGKWLDDISDVVASSAILGGIFYGALRSLPVESWPMVTALYLPALFLNAYYGFKVSVTKQSLRREYLRAGAGDRRFVRSQHVLDRFTGREPFYLLLLLALFAFHQGAGWIHVLLGVLIAGCYAFSLGYWIVDHRLRMNRAFAGGPELRKERALAEGL